MAIVLLYNMFVYKFSSLRTGNTTCKESHQPAKNATTYCANCCSYNRNKGT